MVSMCFNPATSPNQPHLAARVAHPFFQKEPFHRPLLTTGELTCLRKMGLWINGWLKGTTLEAPEVKITRWSPPKTMGGPVVLWSLKPILK